MNRTSKKSSPKSNVSRKTFIVGIVVAFSLSLLISLGSVLAVYIHLITREDTNSLSKITYFINEAVRQLNQDTPTASFSNKWFIDEMRVTFTKSDPVRLVHRYEKRSDTGDETLQLADANLIDYTAQRLMAQPNVQESLNIVPQLQKCSRLFLVSFSKELPGYEEYDFVAEKQLMDGRIAYIWKINGLACVDNNVEEIQKVVESIKSY